MLGECFYEAYYWAGISEFKSYLFAGLSAMATHVAIDVKDGFAPSWGFSVFDVLSGTLGGFFPMMERYVPVFKYVDLKWSYWINTLDRRVYRRLREPDFLGECETVPYVATVFAEVLPELACACLRA